ncbi:hypothetical protein GN244_ATG03231 [Phytophthora infestans]|uniref:Uncharacterized protein n=1 Tax=Phytophthora infestans TaxID=4787 RepID=A0A833SZU3_PHYIN|nr:hypothetical protein GN244_ATG03231 [Phytophthora infestans]KAF4147668.1 hypothetical protein GN958_ATG03023 [Phytophthora infestans]
MTEQCLTSTTVEIASFAFCSEAFAIQENRECFVEYVDDVECGVERGDIISTLTVGLVVVFYC